MRRCTVLHIIALGCAMAGAMGAYGVFVRSRIFMEYDTLEIWAALILPPIGGIVLALPAMWRFKIRRSAKIALAGYEGVIALVILMVGVSLKYPPKQLVTEDYLWIVIALVSGLGAFVLPLGLKLLEDEEVVRRATAIG